MFASGPVRSDGESFSSPSRERWSASRETDNRIGERIRESDRLGSHDDLWRSRGKNDASTSNSETSTFSTAMTRIRRPRFDGCGCAVKLLHESDQLSRASDRCWASVIATAVSWNGSRQADRLGIRNDARRPGDKRH